MKFILGLSLAVGITLASSLVAPRTAVADTYCVTEVDAFIFYRQVRCLSGSRDGRIQQVSYRTTFLFWTWVD